MAWYDRYLYPKRFELKRTQAVVQQVTVNGVTQNVTADVVSLACPTCGMVLAQMQQGMSEAEVSIALAQNPRYVEGLPNFCPNCGQKIGKEVGIVEVTCDER